jgi:starvation-inducible DNA-binding protein
MATKTQRASATMFESRNSLNEDARAQMVELLNQQLADTLDLYTQAKQAHWNVKGRDFYQLHELFDTLADALPPHIDEIAERVTALGGKACGTARMSAASSRLEEFPSDLREGMDFVTALAERYATYGASLLEGISAAEEADDPSTADLLTDISREIDKHLYFLEAHLQA